MKSTGVASGIILGLVVSGCGGGSSTGNVNIRTMNLVRTNASANTSINVTADTAILATGLAYGSVTNYGSLSSFPQNISAVDPTSTVNLGSLTLSATGGNFYTLYVTGVENGSPASTLVLLQDTAPAATTTSGNVRFGNFITSITGNVDVYFTLVGSTAALSTLTPNFSNVAYGSVSAYALLPAGSYKVWVTATGNPANVETTASPYTVVNGTDYSVYGDDASPTVPSLVQVTDTY